MSIGTLCNSKAHDIATSKVTFGSAGLGMEPAQTPDPGSRTKKHDSEPYMYLGDCYPTPFRTTYKQLLEAMLQKGDKGDRVRPGH